jgi:tetratricopeptide (TPR) repeat protein
LAQEWTWLQQSKRALDGRRTELARLQGEAAAAEGAPELAPQVAELDRAVTAQAEEFASRLVAFLNDDPMLEGVAPSERQLAAVRMKSAEDLILAQEWIDKGGDYKRALDIYDTALALDPDNGELEAARATAEAARLMTAERFALASRGMSEAQVRSVLGQPNLHNIREYPERGVVAWFYPISERGDAAGVWFEVDAETGASTAYQLKYDAIQRQEPPAAEGAAN